jgi:hypothetical protein
MYFASIVTVTVDNFWSAYVYSERNQAIIPLEAVVQPWLYTIFSCLVYGLSVSLYTWARFPFKIIQYLYLEFAGIAVPSGLFIPALLSGAALGRLVGEVLLNVFRFPIQPGRLFPRHLSLPSTEHRSVRLCPSVQAHMPLSAPLLY